MVWGLPGLNIMILFCSLHWEDRWQYIPITILGYNSFLFLLLAEVIFLRMLDSVNTSFVSLPMLNFYEPCFSWLCVGLLATCLWKESQLLLPCPNHDHRHLIWPHKLSHPSPGWCWHLEGLLCHHWMGVTETPAGSPSPAPQRPPEALIAPSTSGQEWNATMAQVCCVAWLVFVWKPQVTQAGREESTSSEANFDQGETGGKRELETRCSLFVVCCTGLT